MLDLLPLALQARLAPLLGLLDLREIALQGGRSEQRQGRQVARQIGPGPLLAFVVDDGDQSCAL